MTNVKTVDRFMMDDAKQSITIQDPLLRKQKEDVAKMRASLLACSQDASLSNIAIKNITVLRVYHQVSRIIRYLDMMDKIEAKLYEAIESRIDGLDIDAPESWNILMSMQSKLQYNMIESHKLLQPYLNIQEFNLLDLTVSSATTEASEGSLIDKTSRDKLRSNAQVVLSMLSQDEVIS